MGWIAGEEMDVCDSVAEEGMSTLEAARRDGEKWMSVRKRRQVGHTEGRDGEGKNGETARSGGHEVKE
jgi:hypothetical protein